jgi:hypothetical protein
MNLIGSERKSRWAGAIPLRATSKLIARTRESTVRLFFMVPHERRHSKAVGSRHGHLMRTHASRIFTPGLSRTRRRAIFLT